MRHAFPELAPLPRPQDTGARDSVLLTAVCAQCGGLITITLSTLKGMHISHHNGCQHPATAIAAIRVPGSAPLPREAD